MLCDGCSKNKVCKYSEQCRILERDMNTRKLEDIISLAVNCKEFVSNIIYRDRQFKPPNTITTDRTWNPYPHTTSSVKVDPDSIPKSFIGARNTEDVTEFWSYDKPATYDSQKGNAK